MRSRVMLLMAAALAAGCGPECLRGHHETRTRHVKARTNMVPMRVGKITHLMPRFEPAHDVQEFVCDEYEADAR